MLSAIPRALYTPSLLSSASNFGKEASTVKCLLISTRTFLTTISVAEEVETTKEKHTQTSKKHEGSNVTNDQAVEVPKEPKTDLYAPNHPPRTGWHDFYHQYVVECKIKCLKNVVYPPDVSIIWQAMSAEKAKYESPAAEVAKYRRVLKENPSMVAQAREARKLPKSSSCDVVLRVKRLFVTENNDKNSPLPIIKRVADLAGRWTKLNETEKETYKQRAIELYEKTGS